MKHFNTFLLFLAAIFAVSATHAQSAWPKTIPFGDNGKLTMYEPQPETLEGKNLTGRAAISIRKTPNDEPVFGSLLFAATLSDDKAGSATFNSFEVTNAKFPNIEDQSEVDDYMALLEKQATGWQIGATVDQLENVVKEQNDNEAAFNNSAPKILYAAKPTTLVVLDGEPKVLHDKDLDADKVVNSPNLIFKEGKQWNLYAGGNWYKSASVKSGWKQNTNLSAKVKSINEQIKKQELEQKNDKTKEAEKPRLTDIVVTTEPAELLQTEGEPVYKTVSGTALLYVSNSPNEIFKDISSQDNYILIAGRWYRAKSVKGPWSYVASDKLPADFAKIPGGSEKAEVLSNVAGTDAADEARLDAEIPQTAKVDRKTATIDVQYDGAPVFNRIEGTSLSLAENANVTVMIDAAGNYFALDNGIWFISDDAEGPWAVANDRPRDIDNIPPSSPAYNSRYVYVYDYTPDYVYTGYTSGYLGSYVYGPTIVYGTGYYYRPWFHNVYYPRPFTWGFGFTYDPWWGWNMNWGYNYGYMYVGFNYGRPHYYGYGYGGCGWFGPSRYYPGYRRPYWNNGYYGRRDYYGRAGGRGNYYGSTGRPGNRNLQSTGRPSRSLANNNVYNNQNGVVTRNVNRTARTYRPVANRSNIITSNGAYRERNTTGTIEDRRRSFDRPQSQSGRQVEGYRGTNGRITTPQNGSNTNRPTLPSQNSEQRPIQRPAGGERPAIERPATSRPERVERPASGERPTYSRPERIERPMPASRPGSPQPERRAIERPSSPQPERRAIERPSSPRVERSSAPAPRPEINRQQAPSRPQVSRPAPQSSGSRGGGDNGSRPQRR